ncbi:MAG: PQQ-binding-like beta-propeller repeat protein [Actinobacteria bacterium]|nr:PQQ-binding-like beta-propeller repeat protein [Actinomycetota bacterium]
MAAGLFLYPASTASAGHKPHPGVATSTTLTASATSVAQDSWVTFQAQVTSKAGTPDGSVTFSDASNGSILGTSVLVSGTATLATAALAPGTRQLVARYSGSTSFDPSSSAEVAISVAQAGSDAVTYQIDPAHDGSQAFDAPSASALTERWSVTLGGTGGNLVEAGDVSYPVIAGGRVFVTVENTQTWGTHLYALDASNGATDWSVALAGSLGFSALAYDGQAIFALNYDGLLTAFSASTGQELWATQMPGQWAFTAPPTAYDGVVYVTGAGYGGYVYAVSEADGIVQWDATVANGDKSSPAVDDSGIYVSYVCQQDYRFSMSGDLVWHHDTFCSGGGGSTAVLDGSKVYARGAAADTPLILSKSVGGSVGTFASRTAPAFDSNNMYTIDNGNLVAVDPSGSPDRWSFGDGTLATAPVVAGGAVFVGSTTGTVYAVSASTGQQIWAGVAGSAIEGPDEQNADVLVGLAVGGGLLVVPAGNALTAFGG